MKQFKFAMRIIIALVVLAAVGFFVVTNWGWVFSKRVQGVILNADRVTDPSMIMSPRTTEAQIHQYSVLIQSFDGKLYTATSVDPQWQSKKGFCVDARLFRYPPWRLSLAGTFYNARVLELSVCKDKPAPPPGFTEPGDVSAGSSAPGQNP
jgi:hypothetical protein